MNSLVQSCLGDDPATFLTTRMGELLGINLPEQLPHGPFRRRLLKSLGDGGFLLAQQRLPQPPYLWLESMPAELSKLARLAAAHSIAPVIRQTIEAKRAANWRNVLGFNLYREVLSSWWWPIAPRDDYPLIDDTDEQRLNACLLEWGGGWLLASIPESRDDLRCRLKLRLPQVPVFIPFLSEAAASQLAIWLQQHHDLSPPES
jgi:hypothetical protein